MNEYHFELPLETEAELALFVQKAFGVVIPDVRVCQNHQTPWRAFADAYFARSPVAVWKASRGFGGKSYLLALLGLTEACTHKCDVNILGGSGEQSENVHKYCEDFWNFENAPRQLLASDPAKRHTRLSWGNTIKALLASQRSVRGPHIPRLRLDEIDEMDIAIFDAAMGQTMAKVEGQEIMVPAQTVASSTHQNADGTMTEVLRRAGEKGWPVYEWCYKETSVPGSWLLPSEIERKRGEVTAEMWRVEYDLQEPSPESRAITPAAVEAMFDRGLGEYRGDNGEYLEFAPPEAGAKYSTGADWARKRDWTVIPTARTDTAQVQMAAFERMGRRPWPAMVGRFNDRLKRYGGRAAHDATGLGDVVDGYLEVKAQPVTMVGRKRSDMLSNYISAVEHGEYVAPFIKWLYNEHKYASVDDVYGAGHLPDGIAAMALLHHATGRGFWAR